MNSETFTVSCCIRHGPGNNYRDINCEIEKSEYTGRAFKDRILNEIQAKYPEITDIKIGFHENAFNNTKIELAKLFKIDDCFYELNYYSSYPNLTELLRFPVNVYITSIASAAVEASNYILLKTVIFKNAKTGGKKSIPFFCDKNYIDETIDFILQSPFIKTKLNVPNDAEISFKFFDRNENETKLDFNTLSFIQYTVNENLLTKTYYEAKSVAFPMNAFQYKKPKKTDQQLTKEYLKSFANENIHFHFYGNLQHVGFPLIKHQKSFNANIELITSKLKEKFYNISHYFCFIGPSGCGKTSTIYEIAKRIPVIYVDLGTAAFINMLLKPSETIENVIKEHYSDVPNNYPDRMDDFERLLKIVFSRFFYAIILYFESRTSLTPEELINEQFNGASAIIEKIWQNLSPDLDYNSLVYDYFSNKYPRFTIVFDEAQKLCSLCKSFHSESDTYKQPDPNPIIKPSFTNNTLFDRHLFYALTKYLYHFTINALFSGTSFLLQQAFEASSRTVKDDTMFIIVNFGLCEDPVGFLSSCLNLTDVRISPNYLEMLKNRKGNYRYTSSIINELVNIIKDNPKISKKKAIEQAINTTEQKIEAKFSEIFAQKEKFMNDFSNIISFELFVSKAKLFQKPFEISLKATELSKKLSLNSDCFHFRKRQEDFFTAAATINTYLYEPIIINALASDIKTCGYNLLQSVCENELKPDLFEDLCRYQLCYYDNYFVSDLPFLKGLNLPSWADSTKISISKFGCSTDFVTFDKTYYNKQKYKTKGKFPSNITQLDALFIDNLENNVGNFLIPSPLTRPDGFLSMKDEQNNICHPLLMGIKCYKTIDKNVIMDNTKSTNPKLLFHTKKETVAGNGQKSWDIIADKKFSGSLRIHVIKSNNAIYDNSTIDGDNIIVHINENNFKDFFGKNYRFIKRYLSKEIIESRVAKTEVKNDDSSPKKGKSTNASEPNSKKRKFSGESVQDNPSKRQKTTKQLSEKSKLRRSLRLQKKK